MRRKQMAPLRRERKKKREISNIVGASNGWRFPFPPPLSISLSFSFSSALSLTQDSVSGFWSLIKSIQGSLYLPWALATSLSWESADGRARKRRNKETWDYLSGFRSSFDMRMRMRIFVSDWMAGWTASMMAVGCSSAVLIGSSCLLWSWIPLLFSPLASLSFSSLGYSTFFFCFLLQF